MAAGDARSRPDKLMISGPIRDWRMRSVKAGASYFILVLAVGWILGPIRTVWAAPRFGGHMATNDLIRAMILAAALAATTFVDRKSVV